MNRISTRRINKIKRLASEGVTQTEIAKRVKVSMKTVSRHINGETPVVKQKRKYTKRKATPMFTPSENFNSLVLKEVAKIIADRITF